MPVVFDVHDDVQEREEPAFLAERERVEPLVHLVRECFEGPLILFESRARECTEKLFAVALEGLNVGAHGRGGGFEGWVVEGRVFGVVADEAREGVAGAGELALGGVEVFPEGRLTFGEAAPDELFSGEGCEACGVGEDPGDGVPDGLVDRLGEDLRAAAVLVAGEATFGAAQAQVAGFAPVVVADIGAAAARPEPAREQVIASLGLADGASFERGLELGPFGLGEHGGNFDGDPVLLGSKPLGRRVCRGGAGLAAGARLGLFAHAEDGLA